MSHRKKPSKRITTKAVQASEDKPYTLPKVDVKPDVDTDGFGNDGLTVRQRLFVDALIGPAGGNATKAAEMAGYASENRNALAVTACRLLGNAKVQEAIAHAHARLRDTPEWARASLVEIASASMANFLTVGEDGKPFIDWTRAAEMGAIGQVREYREEVAEIDGKPVVVNKRSFKLHDALKARETLLKLHGKLTDQVHHSGSVTHTHAIDLRNCKDEELETLARIARDSRARAGIPLTGRN